LELKLIKVPVERCIAPTLRSKRDADYCRGLGENMKSIGQQVPGIGYWVDDWFQLTDAGCRLEGACLVGMTELLALDLGKKPTLAELLLAQASIDLMRKSLPPVDRARLWQANLDERKCTAKELAGDLHVSDSLIGRYLLLLTLAPDLQEQVNDGTLKWTKGSLIARTTSDHDRQRELAALATGMSRDALAAAVRRQVQSQDGGESGKQNARTSRVKCELGNDVSITIAGNALGLDEVIEALGRARKSAIKARDDNWNVKSWSTVMRDRANKES
jgi:ParB family chromosome partitioning protein